MNLHLNGKKNKLDRLIYFIRAFRMNNRMVETEKYETNPFAFIAVNINNILFFMIPMPQVRVAGAEYFLQRGDFAHK